MIKFIDLFCGLGGFRLGLGNDYECSYSCDIEPFCQKIYLENFGDKPEGDIVEIDYKKIPDHDLLVGGFPCPAFSLAGLKEGFDGETGQLIFNVLDIVKEKRPKVVFLENVKNLTHHDSGKTLEVIAESFKELGYNFSHKIFDAVDFGLPQSRKRTMMVASLNKIFDFDKVKLISKKEKLIDFIDKDIKFKYENEKRYVILGNREKDSGFVFSGYMKSRKSESELDLNKLKNLSFHHKANRIYSPDGIYPTLVHAEKTGRYYIYHEEKVRRLTVDECFRIMGFPEDYKKIGAKYLLYRAIGNSVAVPMIKAIGEEIKNQLF